MGFYLRKAIPFGPFRLNLSKSGIGLSAGVTGFRVGVGPRGSYVHAGRGGLYYRQSLGQGSNQRDGAGGLAGSAATQAIEIDSGNALDMVDSSAAELLAELNSKRRKASLQPIAWLFAVAGSLNALAIGMPPLWLAFAALLLLFLVPIAALLDRARKTTVIEYELEEASEGAYGYLGEAFAHLAGCSRLWHIQATERVLDRKYHAGAGSLVTRKPICPGQSAPFLRTNVPIPTLPVGRQLLAFMPDRLLVFESKAVGAVPYEELVIEVTEKRFTEHEGVPPDSRVVDRTWQYVNRDGGPDRRFRPNPELPIVAYEEIHFSSPSGLNETIQVSRMGVGMHLQRAIAGLAGTSPRQE
jgi:hypothetical protein